MQEKVFRYPRIEPNEKLTSAICIKYAGGVDIEIKRSDEEISLKLSGSDLLVYEAVKDLMANVCYLKES